MSALLQSSSCAWPPDFDSGSGSTPTAPTTSSACSTAAPHRFFCAASFFGSQCGGNGLVGSTGGWFTRPTLKYDLWSLKNIFQCRTPCVPDARAFQTWFFGPPEREWRDAPTSSSPSESPRRSCVRCSLKQPVPNARAASTPALSHHNKQTGPPARKRHSRDAGGVHVRVGPAWAINATITRHIINLSIDLPARARTSIKSAKPGPTTSKKKKPTAR